MSESGIVEIHGKEYHTVAKRVADFRKDHPDYAIATKVIERGDLVLVRATIYDNQGRNLSTGYAEENRTQGINRTSAVENAETSAVGRALGFLGYGGTAIATADEMESAVARQKELDASEYLLKHNEVVRDHLPSIIAIKGALDLGDYSTAKEAWNELEQDEQRALWVAPSKGGIFSTHERELMKSTEWRQAHG